MKVYQNEIDLGLADAISVASLSVLGETSPLFSPEEFEEFAVATNLGQDDLYYSKSLLVSTGFNKNFDFFPIVDTWNARFSPIDKPSSIDHVRNHVVGHSTDAVAFDREGNQLTENDGTVDFDIVDASVIYCRGRGTKEENERIEKLIDEIEEGKYCVSMECFFANFDYVLVPRCSDIMEADMSKAEFIERNEKTSHLSKYLQVYNKKADNTYMGQYIGRVLRQITFAGKGYTKNPANPTSAIYTFNGKKLSGKISNGLALSVYNKQEEEKQMQELEDVKKKLAETEAALASAKKELEGKDAELTAAKTATEAVASERAKALADAEQLKNELAQANEKIGKVEAEKRFDAIVGKVKLAYTSATDEKALEIAKTLVPLTDEQVEANLNAVTVVVKPVETKTETPAVASVIVDETPKTKNDIKPKNDITPVGQLVKTTLLKNFAPKKK